MFQNYYIKWTFFKHALRLLFLKGIIPHIIYIIKYFFNLIILRIVKNIQKRMKNIFLVNKKKKTLLLRKNSNIWGTLSGKIVKITKGGNLNTKKECKKQIPIRKLTQHQSCYVIEL